MTSALEALRDTGVLRQRIPGATYRLQLNRSLTFKDAMLLIPYLHALGITDVYASPILQARQGSMHGYDICVHNRINPDLGTREDFEAFSVALKSHDMGLVLDIVPNHMAVNDATNAWWMDVLENGPSSAWAAYFDIDWHPFPRELEDKILLPILGEQYGTALERGLFQVRYDAGAFYLHVYEKRLPVAPRSYGLILAPQAPVLAQALGPDHPHTVELLSILTAIHHLPDRIDRHLDKIIEQGREKEVIKRRLSSLCEASPEVRAVIEASLAGLNGHPGDVHSFDALEALIDAQSYRLAYWRVATEEINYRRFFDVNDLAAIRMELPGVFEATHALIFELLSEGHITGLRVDHPDGLWSPATYFRDLQRHALMHRLSRALEPSGPPDPSQDLQSLVTELLSQHRDSPRDQPLYVVAEKILSRGEALPGEWAIEGTTGYDFLNRVNGLFVDARHSDAFDRIYHDFIGRTVSFPDLARSCKLLIMEHSMSSEINALSAQLDRLTERNRHYRDFTLNGLTDAVREVIAALPIYRTYVNTLTGSVTARDRGFIEEAVATAMRRSRHFEESIFRFLRDTLLLENLDTFRAEDRPAVSQVVMKFQQLTGPIMAKGIEDTAFYRYNRFVSLNEVGGDPERFGSSIDEVHTAMREQAERWPHSMLASSTHDTKRSEDVRARLDVLSEIPEVWRKTALHWRTLNEPLRTTTDGVLCPDRNDEYLLYQTLVGIWPMEPVSRAALATLQERLLTWLEKALRESKAHSSWINPDAAYESATRDFARRLLKSPRFITELNDFVGHMAPYGRLNSLSQLVLKLTAPGVPDFYQGSELWSFHLVDPDNRMPVDFASRRALLSALERAVEAAGADLRPVAHALLKSPLDGRIKLYVTWRTLALRRAHADLFAQGSYQTLEATGTYHEHLFAFARRQGDEELVVVVPRLLVGLTHPMRTASPKAVRTSRQHLSTDKKNSSKPPARLPSLPEARLPLGEAVWRDTWLELPQARPDTIYRNLYTGEVHHIASRDGRPGIPCAAIFTCFPVAVLTGDI